MGVLNILFKIYIILSLVSLNCVISWDTEDLEIFDLVEEVNQNFYDVLNVSSSADSNDLRRAYRKLSLQLHPDKNKEIDAEVRFRQMVAVYEVLKDEKKRTKYNEVLANGLPDWRQPVYYYRRVRKMGLLEFAVLLSIILTTGHFITMWSIYLERRYEKEEVFRSRRKRDKKGRRGLQTEGDTDDELQEELNLIRRPVITDLLPCALYRLILQFIKNLPSTVRLAGESLQIWIKSRYVDESSDDCHSPAAEKFRSTRKKPSQTVVAPETVPFNSAPNVTIVRPSSTEQSEVKYSDIVPERDEEWTDNELALLAKAVARYPGGTAERWHKISHMVGRSVKEVTAMSHQMKTHYAKSVDPCSQGITGAMPMNRSAGMSMQPAENLGEYEIDREESGIPMSCEERQAEQKSNVVKSNGPSRKIDRTLMIAQLPVAKSNADCGTTNVQAVNSASKGTWTQQQQRQLEMALNQFPKGTADRWDRITEAVPGKTKDECMQRFKYLAELVVKKKQQRLSAKQNEQSTLDIT